MGLIQSAEAVAEHHGGIPAHKSGLLAKAAAVLKEPASFQQWAEIHAIRHAGLFTKLGRRYVLTQAYGLDAKTVAGSVSTPDFWSGTLSLESGWITCSVGEKKTADFYQLVSPEIREQILSLSFLRINEEEEEDSPILMVVCINTSDILPDADSQFKRNLTESAGRFNRQKKTEAASFITASQFGLQIAQAKLLLVSVKFAIESAIGTTEKTGDNFIREQISKTVFDEVVYCLKEAFQFPNECCEGTNQEIKIVLFSKSLLSDQLVWTHIIRTLEPILGSDAVESVQLLPAGYCDRIKGIQDFLIQG